MSIIIVPSTIIFLGLMVWAWLSPKQIPFLTLFVLGSTLIALVIYTFETHRIADQTLDSNLRPIVLRSGYITWDSVKFETKNGQIDGTPLNFNVYKNIAKDISGHINLGHKKFDLLFGSSISEITNKESFPNPSQQLYSYVPAWGWLAPDYVLWAVFDSTKSQPTNEENGIYIQYKDIENNSYYTKEDKNFSQTTGGL